MENYQIAIIGSGPAGYVAAIRAAQLGFKVACIEKRDTLGGTCLNVGCIPSKALLHSSEYYHWIQEEGKNNGIGCSSLKLNFSQMMKRKESIVSSFTQGIEALFKKNKITKYLGTASFEDPHVLQIQKEEGIEKISAEKVLIATGSEPIALPFLPFDEKKVLSSTGALAFEEVPKNLLVIGAGIIGIELGSVYQRLGSQVEFVEFLDRVAPSFDHQVSKELQKILEKQGMTFHLSHKVVSAEQKQSSLTLKVEHEKGTKTFSPEKVLVAIGRKPYSQDLGLERIGIKNDKKGFIEINSQFQTNHPHIYAIGDVVDGPMLAHKASEDGIAVVEHLAGKSSLVNYAHVPNVAYTNPEVASVGFTEEKLKEFKVSYRKGRFPFKANSRAKCTGEEEGFVKVLLHEPTGKLLGIHILGAKASEMIGEAVVALTKGMTAEELAKASHAHPTLSEAIKEAALAATSGSLHI